MGNKTNLKTWWAISVFLVVLVCVLLVANIASADTFGTGENQFTIDFVPISGSTNPASGYGIVNNDYRMGTYEITNDQWNKFVNAYGTVTGSPSDAYDGSPYWTGTDVPTNRLSWYEAAQFVNYLNTSTGHQAAYKFTGTQGTGTYTLGVWESGDAGYDASNPFRNSEAFYFLPTEDEWVKAAYWNGTSLQEYANASPGDLVSGSPDPAKWNYEPSLGSSPWNVGSGSEELNGTFDMMGNVYEWMESPFFGDYLSGSIRGIRGGSYSYSGNLGSSARDNYAVPYNELSNLGFRVASVPEPATLLVQAPNGGEMLNAGSTYAITWSSAGISDVLIEYSTNNGSNWMLVNPPNVGNTGSYNWTVPAVSSDQCLVSISDASDPSTSDTSDDVFEIIVTCTDNDNDTYAVEGGDCGPVDCNDTDPNIFPGAAELCNGIDDDCDMIVDNGGDALCDDGLYCNGQEICGGASGCQAGTPKPDATPCDDGDPLTTNEVCVDGVCTGEPDSDGDTIPDDVDNCPYVDNPGQVDVRPARGDGIGDVCQKDYDGDGFNDNVDNCPDVNNPDQNDIDGDLKGNACDLCPDDSNDACADGNSVIGPEGGTVTNAYGTALVDIPPGALTEETTISITGETDISNYAIGRSPDNLEIGYIYTFEPNVLTFSVPVTITLIYEQAAIPGQNCTDPNCTGCKGVEPKLDIYYYDDGVGWEPQDANQDCASNTLTLEVEHFSTYVVIAIRDSDNDEVLDPNDNCPYVYNPDQADSDSDGIGDTCECYAANIDGVDPVNFEDFAMLAPGWRLTVYGLAGDTNRDESVDLWDLAQLAQHWLSDCGQP